MFFDDAKLVSGLLGLTLTARDSGNGERAPMCGVPYHSAAGYINKLIELGHKVAICEQMSDPALSRGLVEREVIRVVTPGTVVDAELLDDKRNLYLLSLCAGKKRVGIAYADVSTGDFAAYEISAPEDLPDAIASIHPAEIIADAPSKAALEERGCISGVCEYESAAFGAAVSRKALLNHFQADDLSALGLAELPLAARAAGGLLAYIMETQRNAMRHISKLRVDERSLELGVDRVARRNLELTQTMAGSKGKGTLFHLLDATRTAMGGRELRMWTEHPLNERSKIEARLEAVAALYANEPLTRSIQGALKGMCDLERLLCKISYKSLTARDALALRQTFGKVPELARLICELPSRELIEIARSMDSMDDLCALIDRMISLDAPALPSEGGVILDGYNAELDSLRTAARNGKQWLCDFEAREREQTGIRNLKIVYSRVFGYLIEVTKSSYDRIPKQRYQRRQTLSNAERFSTDELTDIERTILGAEEKSARLEAQLFASLTEWLSEHIPRMQKTSKAIERLDALASLAVVAIEHDYVRPTFNDEGVIDIKDGRHPVVETMLVDEPFVPNDTLLDMSENRFQILTGPNMAGKSTYMRQVALIVLMAQMGGFVPAREANLCIVDKLFTRVGASDDLASGRSTFLVEMSETASILRGATARSLILLDEIGRGTSTFDGLSIAWAIVEHISNSSKLGAKTMFATHYHELGELEGRLPGVVNYYARVKDQGDAVVFLRKIARGSADRSFGVYVAALAGLPRAIIARAQSILARIEAGNAGGGAISRNILGENISNKKEQLTLGETERTELIEEIRALDVMSMTPMEALNLMFRLHEKALRL
jgi:DNA mismatch repair protein MutS